MKMIDCVISGITKLRSRRLSTYLFVSVFMTFFAACSTPTVSSDDAGEDEYSSSIDKLKESFFNPDIDYGSMTDSRDGRVYRTVKIGEQTWMAENLNYAIANGSFCYGNVSSNCAKYGRLYTWAAAIDSVKLYDDGDGVDCGYGKTCKMPEKVQGACPGGWHLPSNTEWSTLFTTVGGKSMAGKMLKSQSGWYKDGNGSDSVGFAAQPAGRIIYNTGAFNRLGSLADFWTASGGDSEKFAYAVFLDYDWDRAAQNNVNKVYGHSVRCVKD